MLVLPIALLLALLYALTNHARHQEITAMRAAGVSLWRMSLPYLGVGFLASLALFATNEFWVPSSDDRAKAILKRHQAPDPHAAGRNEYRNLCFDNTRDGRRWRIGVYNTQTGEMIEPGVYPVERDGSKPWELRADRAQRVDGVWTFYNVQAFKEAADHQRAAGAVPAHQRAGRAGVHRDAGRDQQRDQDRDSMTLRAAKKADVPIKDLLQLRAPASASRAAPTGAGSIPSWQGGWRRRGRAWWWC